MTMTLVFIKHVNCGNLSAQERGGRKGVGLSGAHNEDYSTVSV